MVINYLHMTATSGFVDDLYSVTAAGAETVGVEARAVIRVQPAGKFPEIRPRIERQGILEAPWSRERAFQGHLGSWKQRLREIHDAHSPPGTRATGR